MKKSILFHLLFFSTLLAFAQIQDKPNEKKSVFRPALMVGMNATQVDGDDLAGYRKVGLNAGAGVYVLLPRNFSVNMEILYSQKGARTSANQMVQNSDDYKLILDYVDIPLIFNYHDKDNMKEKDVAIFGLGFIVNTLVRNKQLFGGQECVGNDCNEYRKLGLEAVANVIFVFARKFGVNLRFTYSMLNITSKPVDYSNLKNGGQRNNVLTFRTMYFF